MVSQFTSPEMQSEQVSVLKVVQKSQAKQTSLSCKCVNALQSGVSWQYCRHSSGVAVLLTSMNKD